MSLVKTLAKVAIGVAVAKGVSTLAKGGLGGGAANAGTGRTYSPDTSGGLGDVMGEILGGKRSPAPAPGQRAPAPGGLEGGLGGLLEQLAGGGSSRSAGTTTSRRQSAPGGIEDLLDSLMGGKSGTTGSGGLGDLLGAVLGGTAAAGTAGGLGGMLNDALSGGKTVAAPSREQEAAAGLMLKAMIQAIKADGKLDAEEKKKLMANMGEATQTEIAFVNAELSAPVDIDGLARMVPRGMEQQVYLMSLMAIDLDNRAEAEYLHALAQALELEPREVNAIHDHAGAPKLYS